jgi:ABC-type lipoprotein export system ATPase subunit
MNNVLHLGNIVKTYFLKNETIEVLKDVDLDVKKGEFIVIVGPSGSGKSTLLNIIGSLDRPTSGKVILDNVDIAELDDRELSVMRNEKLGFVFQFHHLLAEFTCLENIALPGLLRGKRQKTVYKKAAELLEKFNMLDKADRLPEYLSGGEKQRVAIARALINDPLIILADEPAGNLDEGNTNKLIEVFSGLKNEDRTVILVTHSLDIAKSGSSVYNLKEGRLYAV